VVSSEQIVEELLCAGDVAPAHALAVLLHLQAIEVDGKLPTDLDKEGPKLAPLVEQAATRRERTRLAVNPDSDDESLAGLQSLLGALYAGFVQDVDVFILEAAS
jgi:hypothetical protein